MTKAKTLLLLLCIQLLSLVEAIQRYNLMLTYNWDKQDGHGRPTFLINGDTPGPVLEVEEDETLEVLVDNQLSIETTIHWHGIYQVDEPWGDGVPGVTQWATEPRDNYTYRMTPRHQYGSYFYHGHFGPAFSDGQRGPIWVKPASWRPRPYGLISKNENDVKGMRRAEENPHHIITADWNDAPMDMYLVRFRDTNYIPICANSLTLNGRGQTRCESAQDIEAAGGPDRTSRGCYHKQLSGWQYSNDESNGLVCKTTKSELHVIQAKQDQKWVMINFINSGAHHELAISVDEHEMWVIASDGEFVEPQKVVRTHHNLGERTSVLIELDKPAGDYAVRLHSLRHEQIIQGAGILRYSGKQDLSRNSNTTVPSTKPWLNLNGSVIDTRHKVMDERALAPFPPKQPPQEADISLKFMVNMTGPSTWVLNAQPHEFFRQNVPPIMWSDGSRGNTSYGNANGFMKNGSVVDLIIENGAGADSNHPFHKHNHKVWVIGQGEGGFPFKDVEEALEHGYSKYFNMVNPPYRDGFTLYSGKGKFVVVRYLIDFPAVSMLHCHMIHHFASGQQVILLEGMESMPEVPQELKDKPHVQFDTPVRYGPMD